ncbi:anhydro-N-acetylmuramic acid kinase [Maritalea porphyrae]|uniref:anhydro-N-acetylmuramic acid kinase n=1 Tax=Maritalea porphyrae TaxID=880732 RepID=UPI0022AF6C54|nr:anhydro-N-acetylmuramic acid kinase [Maritalea porphyrae]MCZ4274151.1 anhydro-N-acetylmuramic acid kinase [Maritalea porphyrae]
MKSIWSVGLMTGTVLDGNIDVALIRTDGKNVQEFGPYTLAPYEDEVNQLLAQALAEARVWNFDGPEPEIFAKAEAMLTDAQSEAVQALVKEAGMRMDDIGAVGFHGQSVLHRAPAVGQRGQTRQLGDGARMHRSLGIPVIYDFRSADVNAGGQGAPLSAIYHAALLRGIGAEGDVAILNLGGVANISWTDGADQLIAFDTGPANAPTNDFMKARGLGAMDVDGALALSGEVDQNRLAELLAHAYLRAPFPKSLDRFDFGPEMANGLTNANGAATLAAFTAGAVGKGLDLLPKRPKRLIVCGGGRKNPAMMKALAEHTACVVDFAEQYGWRGDAVEAECFALLAVRTMNDLPISFPTTTGVAKPMSGGLIAK